MRGGLSCCISSEILLLLGGELWIAALAVVGGMGEGEDLGEGVGLDLGEGVGIMGC